eukprot:TRINITY_DN9661_c2_g1_i1.p1 TRINITY_DN9661_c2_g1~~TRINITY_DN9661_c2_g1_i1.p1  ORF type:complete len:1041 (+),score=311.89 TRINITY_DN9661_c2_g1_i1:77-3199(+)
MSSSPTEDTEQITQTEESQSPAAAEGDTAAATSAGAEDAAQTEAAEKPAEASEPNAVEEASGGKAVEEAEEAAKEEHAKDMAIQEMAQAEAAAATPEAVEGASAPAASGEEENLTNWKEESNANSWKDSWKQTDDEPAWWNGSAPKTDSHEEDAGAEAAANGEETQKKREPPGLEGMAGEAGVQEAAEEGAAAENDDQWNKKQDDSWNDWKKEEGGGDGAAEDAAEKKDETWGNWNNNESNADAAAADNSNWDWNKSSTAAADGAADDAWNSWGKKDNKGSWAADAHGQAAVDAWNSQPAGPSTGFWQAQEWSKSENTLARKAEWELEKLDLELFQARLGDLAGKSFERYDNVPVDVSGQGSSDIPVSKTFEDIFNIFHDRIPQGLSDNIRRCRYEKPTPVQKYSIPVGLSGRDVMCCAQTGSGKTCAYLVPVIGRMMAGDREGVGSLDVPFEGAIKPEALILGPTRELCIQIHEEAQKFCHRTPYVPQIVYGGKSTKEQMQEIASGCDVLTATPMRLTDFVGRGIIDLSSVHILVLDEADRMLDMGFEPQVTEIVESHNMPDKENRQTLMFSATFPEKCQQLAMKFLNDYIWVGVGIIGGAVETVEQELVQVKPSEKWDKLLESLDNFYLARGDDRCTAAPKALIFVNSKGTAKFLDEKLWECKYDTGALHGDLTQEQREDNLNKFRDGKIDVLTATDVAARGLDIQSVDLVINFDMPTEIDSYIHRIGRTGRIGNTGKALTFIAVDEHTDVCIEHHDTITSLVNVIANAKGVVPEWLSGYVAAGPQAYKRASNDWMWGGKDVRGAATESYRGAGSGDPWADYDKNKSGGWGGGGGGGNDYGNKSWGNDNSSNSKSWGNDNGNSKSWGNDNGYGGNKKSWDNNDGGNSKSWDKGNDNSWDNNKSWGNDRGGGSKSGGNSWEDSSNSWSKPSSNSWDKDNGAKSWGNDRSSGGGYGGGGGGRSGGGSSGWGGGGGGGGGGSSDDPWANYKSTTPAKDDWAQSSRGGGGGNSWSQGNSGGGSGAGWSAGGNGGNSWSKNSW